MRRSAERQVTAVHARFRLHEAHSPPASPNGRRGFATLTNRRSSRTAIPSARSVRADHSWFNNGSMIVLPVLNRLGESWARTGSSFTPSTTRAAIMRPTAGEVMNPR